MGSLWGPFTETFEERQKKLDAVLKPIEEALKTMKPLTREELEAAMEKADERVKAFRRQPSCTRSCIHCVRLD
jgi:F0F1-type ATP synthase membrane subunit b/b'